MVLRREVIDSFDDLVRACQGSFDITDRIAGESFIGIKAFIDKGVNVIA